VSEQILNGTSAQLGYSRWFMLDAGTCWKMQEKRQTKDRHYKKLNTIQKSKQCKIQQNKTSLV